MMGEDPMAAVRELIYAPEPVTLVEKLADWLARKDGYVCLTRGTRKLYEPLAEEIIEFINRNRDT